MNPKDKIYWIKVAFAVLTALICGFLNMSSWNGIFFGLFMLITSYYISLFAIRGELEEIGGTGTAFFTGLFAFIFLWLVLWSLIYTMIMH